MVPPSVPFNRILIDNYSALSHKIVVGDPHQPLQGIWTAPSWVPLAERRRIAAYIVRAAYANNVARLILNPQTNLLYDSGTDWSTGGVREPRVNGVAQVDGPADHREYGDAQLIVDRVVAGVLGETWDVIVEGADDDLAEAPDLPPKPEDPGPDASPQEKRIFTVQSERWDGQATQIVDDWEEAWQTRPVLQDRQDALREWAEDVQYSARMDEALHDCAGLGDTVVVAWPRPGDWPRLAVYDPGFYFPVLDDDSDEDYPCKVHLAWEYGAEGNPHSAQPTHVRRLTFELVELTDLKVRVGKNGQRTWAGPDGEAAPAPSLDGTEQVDETGRVFRLSPWDFDTDGSPLELPGPYGPDNNPTMIPRRSYRTCLVSDATWPIATVGATVDDLSDENAEYRVLDDGTVMNRLDLGCDFLPLVHIPSRPAGKEHYGKSVIDSCAQVLDDLAASDTDLAKAIRYFSEPVLSLAGAKMEGTQCVQPGIVYNLGENGSMQVLDLSAGFEKAEAYNQKLQDRLFVTARVPAEMIGRVSSNKAVSGIAMFFAFAPFSQVVEVMRMSIAPKQALLLKFVQRLAQLQRVLPPGPDIPATLQFGSYKPNDIAATVTWIAAALTAKAISRQTAVEELIAIGVSIEDAHSEVERIMAEDTKAAVDIATATGSDQLAADYLGLELPEPGPGPLPPIALPPVPGQPPVAVAQPVPPVPGTPNQPPQ